MTAAYCVNRRFSFHRVRYPTSWSLLLTIGWCLVLLVGEVNTGWACSCIGASLAEYIDRADGVIIAFTNTNTPASSIDRSVILTVDRTLKGPPQATFKHDANILSTCGPSFTQKARYLIFQFSQKETGKLEAGDMCSGTRTLASDGSGKDESQAIVLSKLLADIDEPRRYRTLRDFTSESPIDYVSSFTYLINKASDPVAFESIVGIFDHPGFYQDLAKINEPEWKDPFNRWRVQSLIRFLSVVNDARAIPILIKLTHSTRDNVKFEAITILSRNYAKAAGVDEVMVNALQHETTAKVAYPYLRRFSKDSIPTSYDSFASEKLTDARELIKINNITAAREVLRQIVTTPGTSVLLRYQASAELWPIANQSTRDQTWKQMSPYLPKIATTKESVLVHAVLDFLVRANSEDSSHWILEAITGSEVGNTIQSERLSKLVLELYQRGPHIRNLTAKRLAQFVTSKIGGQYYSNIPWPFMAFASVATPAQFKKLRRQLIGLMEEQYLDLAEPLLGLSTTPDATGFLLKQLHRHGHIIITENQYSLTYDLAAWMFWWLAELGDSRSLDMLRKYATTGGDTNYTKYVAREALFRLESRGGNGKSMLEKWRKHLASENPEERIAAIRHLAKDGAISDIALIAPFAEFWKRPRRELFPAQEALADLRYKYGVGWEPEPGFASPK